MGRQPLMISYSNQKAHSEKNMERGTTSSNVKKGAWSREEDRKLTAYIGRYGIWNWNHMAKPAGLARSGKSCRLRWINYLKPGVRHGNFTKEEEDTIIKWHHLLGNKWSIIASKLEGRTDNEIKNYWHTRIKKRIVKAVHKPPMKDDESSLAANKVVHSNIISQSLPQVVNHEETDNTTPSCDSESEFWVEDDRKSVHNGATDNTFPCTGTESVWPFDDSLLIELSDQNEVDAKFIADVFVESTSGISSEHHNIWQQLPADLLSLNFDFGDMSMVSGRFTFPYSTHESLADESHIYDLWESL